MTIDQAIKILTEWEGSEYPVHWKDLEDAGKLGIEALIRIKNIRVIELDPELHHLPSED